jgi:uncharacterized membrane protein
MEKRIIGIVLTILGVIGLIYAASTVMKTSGGTSSIKSIAVYGILGLIFFVSGIGLIRNTRDRAT